MDSESDSTPDGLIGNAIECLHWEATKIKVKKYFRFRSNLKEPRNGQEIFTKIRKIRLRDNPLCLYTIIHLFGIFTQCLPSCIEHLQLSQQQC